MSHNTVITIAATSNIICFIFCFILFNIYNRKQRINNKENSIYSKIIILNLLSLISEFVFYYLSFSSKNENLITFFEKIYYSLSCFWMYLQSIYIFAITNILKNNSIYNINQKTKNLLIYISYFIILVIIEVLKIEHVYENGKLLSSKGPAIYFMFTMCLIFIIISFVTILINREKIEKKKTIPLYTFIGIICLEMLLTATGIQLILVTFPMTIVTYLMYHTIENPDVKMLEEVLFAKEQAEKANTAKSEFLSNMSHEIRTPLNAIVGFSESLKEDNIPKESKEKVEDIITASQNLLEIVNGILDISKIEANKLEIINKEYEPAEMFKELVSLAKARIGDKGLDFQVSIDQTIPSVLYGDNTRVKQIILNILTNAIKYTKEGYVIFTVSSVIKDNVCRLIVSVEDSGIGIKQESLPKLFSKFERLNVEKQLTIEGTGLGLAITKKLLDLMNGTIIVQSIYGQGSKFTISLDQRIISVDQPLEKKAPEIESKIVDAKGAKLLLVDDNEMNIKVALTLLKKYHFNIEYCESGRDCLLKLKDNKYDIIFLDDMMPKMSGKETLAKLKENPLFNTPVIALTANALTGMKEEYLSLGFNDYLSKPIEKSELERIIKEFIMNDNKDNINSETSMNPTSIIEKVYKDGPITPPKEVLVIDSNVYTEKVLEDILKQFNVNLTTATNATDAISEVIEQNYDLIFMDDGLIDKNYEKITEDLKSISGFNTPIVLMTRLGQEEMKESIEKCGFIGCISKPINNIEVENIYSSVVNSKVR